MKGRKGKNLSPPKTGPGAYIVKDERDVGVADSGGFGGKWLSKTG